LFFKDLIMFTISVLVGGSASGFGVGFSK